MSFNLRNRSLLELKDFEPRDIRFLLDLATELKRAKYAGTEQPRLKGKNVALIFEKTSTRTRCAFEVAMHDQGGHVTFIDSVSSQLGHKESLKDTARVLGRMFDGIEYRGFHQTVVEEIAQFSHVPVWNGLTDEEKDGLKTFARGNIKDLKPLARKILVIKGLLKRDGLSLNYFTPLLPLFLATLARTHGQNWSDPDAVRKSSGPEKPGAYRCLP